MLDRFEILYFLKKVKKTEKNISLKEIIELEGINKQILGFKTSNLLFIENISTNYKVYFMTST